MNTALLLAHLLAATIWTGGHLVLAIAILPRVLRERDVAALRAFEGAYEKIGMPALMVQVATGLWLASRWLPPNQWLNGSRPATLILAKLALLALTVAIAAHTRLVIVPRLDAPLLPAMAWRIRAVTLLAVAFVAVGVLFRGPMWA